MSTPTLKTYRTVSGPQVKIDLYHEGGTIAYQMTGQSTAEQIGTTKMSEADLLDVLLAPMGLEAWNDGSIHNARQNTVETKIEQDYAGIIGEEHLAGHYRVWFRTNPAEAWMPDTKCGTLDSAMARVVEIEKFFNAEAIPDPIASLYAGMTVKS